MINRGLKVEMSEKLNASVAEVLGGALTDKGNVQKYFLGTLQKTTHNNM